MKRTRITFLGMAIIAFLLGTGTLKTQAFDGVSTNLSSDTSFINLYVGYDNDNTQVTIGDGVTVTASKQVSLGANEGSTNNTLTLNGTATLVSGSTSYTNSTGGIVIGKSGNGTHPAMTINQASTAEAGYLYMGAASNDTATVKVMGKDSQLNILNDAVLGAAASGNKLNVSAGAGFAVGNNLYVGASNTTGNAVNINDGSMLLVGALSNIVISGNNDVTIYSGATLHIGGNIDTADFDDHDIDIRSGAKLAVDQTFTAKDDAIENGLNVILITSNATWHISSPSEEASYVGQNTANNSLTLTNGSSTTIANQLVAGDQSDSKNNKINVTGDAALTLQKSLTIGGYGSNNQLNIDDGSLDVASSLIVGKNSGSSGNQVSISNNGILNVAGDVILGNSSNKNKFTTEGGMLDVGGHFILGKTANADGITYAYADTANRTTIGTNSTLHIHQDLKVGMGGNGNTFSIRDGGQVTVDGDAMIGEASDDNYIFLMEEGGTNNLLDVAGDLVVGADGEDNRFSIYGGTANIAGNLDLGASTNQYDLPNYIHLATTNSVLNVANAINVGASNSANMIRLERGATINTKNLYVGTTDGVSDNTVTISGELYVNGVWRDYVADSLVYITNNLVIGNTNGANNAIVVRDGGTLQVEQTGITLVGTNNTLSIADGGTLKTGDWDFALLTGSATNILLENGSTLHLLGELSGTNRIEGGLSVILDGTNAVWDTGTNSLHIGKASYDNSLTLTNGAWVSTSNDLFIGTLENEDAWPNALYVMKGSFVEVGGDAYLGYANTLKIDSTSQVHIDGNYQQGEFATLEVGVSSNQVQPNLVVEQNAEFTGTPNTDDYPIIRIFNEGVGESNVITIVQAGSITMDGATASSGDIKANIATNLLFGFNVTVSNDLDYSYIILDDFIMRSLGETLGLKGQLLDIADAIESLSNSNVTSMLNILDGMDVATARKAMDNYYGEKMSSTPAHNAINLGVQSVSEQLTKRADNTRGRMAARSTMQAPSGAQGPHTPDQELQGWITGFKTWADRSADGGFDGYDGSINGFLVGADLSAAEGILFGIAGGSATSTMDKDNGASTDTRTTFGSLYASAGNEDWFADASFIYGNSSVDSKLGTVFDTKADYNAQNVAIYFGGGKEIIGNYLIITPQASLLGNYYSQESYEESSSTAVARKIDSFNTLYLQSAIGCNIGFFSAVGDTVVKPEIRAFWLHEFNAKEEDLDYSLVGATGSYNLQLQAPESDIIKLGGGVSAKVGEYLEIRADLDARMASGYSDYTMLGSIRYQF